MSKKIRRPGVTDEALWVKWLLTGIALIFIGLFLLVPLFSVFFEALGKGWDLYLAALVDADALAIDAHPHVRGIARRAGHHDGDGFGGEGIRGLARCRAAKHG